MRVTNGRLVSQVLHILSKSVPHLKQEDLVKHLASMKRKTMEKFHENRNFQKTLDTIFQFPNQMENVRTLGF